MTVTGAIWRDQLTAEQRALLGRDPGVIADQRPDVLVIGGGILGVATAAAVRDAKLGSVQLVEARPRGRRDRRRDRPADPRAAPVE